MKESKKKKRVLDPEEFEEQIRLRYGFLMIQEAEHDRRMRNKAIKLARKRKKQANGLVI